MTSTHTKGTSDFLLRTSDLAPRTLPKRPGALVRISDDPYGLERGILRQEDDCDDLRKRVNWPPFVKIYTENDTSAFRKKRVTLPDGSVVLRVIRPEFAKMLRDLQDGVIDGLVVYDQDRLLRQPRDLEDLIDVIEQTKRPVQGVTGQIDLMTSAGRVMARVLAAFALKSSEDTSRRVSRAALEDARNGTTVRGGPRRYGWTPDGNKLVASEAAILREVVKRVMSGEAISAIARDLQDRNIATVTGAKWTRTTVNAVLRSPRIAGIRGYQGSFHETPPKMNEWWRRAVRVDGEYVMGGWKPLLTIEEWEALQSALDGGQARGATEGQVQRVSSNYLLSGLTQCGLCGTRMVGRRMHGRSAYGCRPKDMGGCNSISRNQAKVDRLVLELAIRKLREERVTGRAGKAPAKPTDEALEIGKKKKALAEQWASGQLDDEDYFTATAALSARMQVVRAIEGERANVVPLPVRARTASELADASVPLHRKRAILADLLVSVIVNPSSRGPHFSPADIVPVWRETE